jgi:ATPase subunit of ABC transporter with duplicated ATPase domains
MVIVSHDRHFIDNCCNKVIILRNQSLTYFRGTLSEYESDFRTRQLHMARMKAASERQTAHFQKTIAENIRQGKKTGDDNRLRQAKSRQKRVEERSGMQVNEKGFKFKLSRDAGGKSAFHLPFNTLTTTTAITVLFRAIRVFQACLCRHCRSRRQEQHHTQHPPGSPSPLPRPSCIARRHRFQICI